MKINWRERFIAAAIHLLVTLLVAGVAAAIIFLVWFPGALAEMVGGTKLFLLITWVDVTLGPLISLVIYSSAKPRRELIKDYTIVGLVQLAALGYGVFTLSVSRPVYVTFVQDRLEVVSAIEFEEADLAAAVDPQYRTLSWTGPRLAAVQIPTDVKERNEIVAAGVAGKDVQLMPKYYHAYDTARDKILTLAQPLSTLSEKKSVDQGLVAKVVAATGKPSDQLRWLLVHHRFGFAIALIDPQTALPLDYVVMDPDEK